MATIGLEVHAELKTKTKMFCDSMNDPHESVPNTHICVVCMGHPGTLPVINEEAVKFVCMVGSSVGGEVADYTEFDRKNYFYPDIPKGYQISQYAHPLVTGGSLDGISITRIHLEEDTARSLHDQGEGSIIDYNRAGVPLMELVTEPVIHDSKTAGNFARELQLLLRTLRVSDADMEKGQMRIEANVSVSSDSSLGTKVEVKNLNSFKAVEDAIEYEIKRHCELLKNKGHITQETRGWDEAKGVTFTQRVKETAHDYRYFPDPDIPKLRLSLSPILSSLDEMMPVLPSKKRIKYKDIGLSIIQVETIISNIEVDSFFSKCLNSESNNDVLKLLANYLTSDLLNSLSNVSADEPNVEGFLSLMRLVLAEKITSRVAKDILKEIVFDFADPETLINERGLMKIDSENSILEIVKMIIARNPEVVEDVKSGKETALQFLVGQGMKDSKGATSPTKLLEVLRSEILSG